MAFGALVGAAARSPELPQQFPVLEEASRLALAAGLFGLALRLPRLDVLRRWRAVASMIGLGMIGVWAISAALVYAIVSLPFETALVVGAILTPTDPILARSVAEGRPAAAEIPGRIRFTLLEESGINDGLAFPFVFLALTFIEGRDVVTFWFAHVVLYSVLGGIVLGLVVGLVAGRLTVRALRREIGLRSYLPLLVLVLALSTVTVGNMIGMDGVLSVFVAGVAFTAVIRPHVEERPWTLERTASGFLTLSVLFLFGLVLPFEDWIDLGWRAPALIAGILLLRRIPVVMVLRPLLHQQVHTRLEALLFGWFGPIGVSALFYAALAMGESDVDGVWTLSSLIIAASIVTYGISTRPVTRLFGREERRETHAPPE